MKQFLLSFLVFFSSLAVGFAQTGTITGQIKDAETGEALPFCSVFVNNTTIATVTDMDGKYMLSGLESGPLELGFSFMGYVAETRKVTLNPGGTLTINLSMKPFAQELSDVEIKASRDKNWERDLRKFQNLFIGIDEAATQTTILNPWVIDFPVASEKGAFVAKADQPIEIENAFLGYKITFNLKDFFDSPTNYRIVGAARFEEMKPESDAQKSIWEKNRAEVYRKSPMNMFRAMLKGAHEREGFYLYGDKAGGSASMNMRSDIFANELGKSVVPYKADPLVTPISPPGTYLLNLKGRIEIHYQKGFAQANTYKDAPYPISWVEVNKGQVKVKENGMVLNPEDVVFSGDMDRKRISNLLPLDYNAEKAILLQDLAKTAKNYQERVYLHTDKPYYYAGDQLFFKGYFAYGNPYLRDELSKVLHVEVISSERDLLIEKKFPIRDGLVVGDFYLPDTLNGEKYFLRAYTNWMRNYGPNHYFLQPLSVLNPYKRIINEEAISAWTNQGVSLRSDKPIFGTREKVTITLNLTDSKGRPAASTLSVGVWDAEQLVPIQRYPNMKESINLSGVPESLGLDRFSYPVEKQLKFSGKVTDEKGKGVASDITAFVNDFQGMIELQSNTDGNFILDEMEFYGPMRLGFLAADKKGRPFSIQLDEQLKAPVSLPSEAYFPKVTTLAKPIKIIEKQEEILSESTQTSGSSVRKAIYGNPDFVIEGEKLMKTGNTTDLVNSLVGNIPGAQVNLVGGTGQQTIRLRGGAISGSMSMEPVVMLDGVVLVSGGATTAADNIRTINPFDIERIEVVTRMVSMLGDQGRNGVIAIYLKDQLNATDNLSGKGMAEYVIEGYQPPGNFFPLDYSNSTISIEKDDRQTLFWNPYLVTDEKGELTLTFYSNDSTGPVVVEIRGLTVDGEIISGTFVLNKK
ncbi:TonB-dependent receptor [Algoriphagus sp. AK58]|uniref:TonB-dependent receptor n=1 Tax=Algoriphagus sp. AK58 TaxID=1406877 RepID=UPI00164EF179|nr:TonB-dependent receptor [Algoriphagus sp. AK58]MBC6367656.1 TonB-dependent receptor [Algoriphagus sp. AK58]